MAKTTVGYGYGLWALDKNGRPVRNPENRKRQRRTQKRRKTESNFLFSAILRNKL